MNRGEFNDGIYNDNGSDEILEKKISIGMSSEQSKNENINSMSNINIDMDFSKEDWSENQKRENDLDDDNRLIADDPEIQINLDNMAR